MTRAQRERAPAIFCAALPAVPVPAKFSPKDSPEMLFPRKKSPFPRAVFLLALGAFLISGAPGVPAQVSRSAEAIALSLESWEDELDAIYKPDETEPEIPFAAETTPDAKVGAKRDAYKTRARTVSKFKKKANPEVIDKWFAEIMPTANDPLEISINSEMRDEMKTKLRTYEFVAARDVFPHASANVFPGKVDEAFPRVGKTYYPSVKAAGWQSTGVYAAPGERVKVSVSKTAVGSGIRLRIGAHTDNLLNSRQRIWRRFPSISREFGISEQSFEIASPFGGLIYVYAPTGKFSARTQFKFSGVVESPSFILGETKASEWEKIRYAPAPWADFVGKNFAATIPAAEAAAIDDPEKVIRFWDDVVGALDKFVGNENFPAKTTGAIAPIRFVADIETTAAAGHSGDPIVGMLTWTRSYWDLDYVRKNGSWPLFYEIAKRMISAKWTFEGDSDAPAALLALYLMERTTGRKAATFFDVPALQSASLDRLKRKEIYEKNKRAIRDKEKQDARDEKAARKRILSDTSGGEGRRERQKKADEADTQDTWDDPGRTFQRLAALIPIVSATGWDALAKTFKTYTVRNRLPRGNDDEKMRTFVMLWSQSTKKNLSPYLETFGFPRQNGAANYPKFAPENFPPPAGTRPEEASGFLGESPLPTIAVLNSGWRVPQLPEGSLAGTKSAKKVSAFGSAVSDDEDEDSGKTSKKSAAIDDPFAGTTSDDDPFAENNDENGSDSESDGGGNGENDPNATPDGNDPFADIIVG